MSSSDATNGDPIPEASRGPEMIRDEEELVIDTRLVETGRARLVKRIEIETVTRTIELRREILEIQRLEPVEAAELRGDTAETPPALQTGPLVAGSMQGGSIEIVLMQEEALISTQMVERERVRLTKQVVTENRTIDADLRAERVELENRPLPHHSR